MHSHAYILVDIHQVCKSVLTADADYEAAYMMCKAVAILTTMAPGVSARTHTHTRAHTHTHTHTVFCYWPYKHARALSFSRFQMHAITYVCTHMRTGMFGARSILGHLRESMEHLCSEPNNHNKCQHIHTETFDVRVFLGRLQESMELMCDEPLSLGYKLASNMDTYQGIWHLTDGMPPSEAPGFVFFCDSLHSHAAEQVS